MTGVGLRVYAWKTCFNKKPGSRGHILTHKEVLRETRKGYVYFLRKKDPFHSFGKLFFCFFSVLFYFVLFVFFLIKDSMFVSKKNKKEEKREKGK